MSGMRLAGVGFLLSVLLLTGCGARLSRQEGAGAVDSAPVALAEAEAAAQRLEAATAKGDIWELRQAYQGFAKAFGEVLGPVSMEDPLLAQKMANAHTAIQEMVTTGKVESGAMEREMTEILSGLRESTTAMAQVRSRPGLPPASSQGAAPPRVPAAAPSQEEKIAVVAREYRFQPAEIRVKKGSKVAIRLENRGTQMHEFEIEELDFEIGPIRPGQTAEKSFIASRAGRFSYECHVDGHHLKGMRGTLIVEE